MLTFLWPGPLLPPLVPQAGGGHHAEGGGKGGEVIQGRHVDYGEPGNSMLEIMSQYWGCDLCYWRLVSDWCDGPSLYRPRTAGSWRPGLGLWGRPGSAHMKTWRMTDYLLMRIQFYPMLLTILCIGLWWTPAEYCQAPVQVRSRSSPGSVRVKSQKISKDNKDLDQEQRLNLLCHHPPPRQLFFWFQRL